MSYRFSASFNAAALMGLVFLLTHPTVHAQSPAASGTVITIAGTGVSAFSGDGGPATNAMISSCYGLAIGPDGTLYFADSYNRRIRAISPTTGIITTLAGTGIAGGSGDGGPATNARIGFVTGLAVDRARQALYFADTGTNRVRKVDLTSGLISNFAGTGQSGVNGQGDGGPAASARFSFLDGLATDAAGKLYVADIGDCLLRRVDPVTGLITRFAGDGSCFISGDGGPALAAGFSYPHQMAFDAAGNVFVLDLFTNAFVRRIDATTGIINTIAGGGTNLPGTGPATSMNLIYAQAIAVDSAGAKLYIGGGWFNEGDHRVFQVDLATGQLSPFAGTGALGFSGDGGPALAATFNLITALAVAPGGGLIIADNNNARLRYVVPDSILLASDNQQTSFQLPWVSSLTGSLIFTNNPNATNVNVGAVTSVGDSVNVSQNTSVTGVDLGSLTTAGGSVNVSGNTAATGVDIGSLATAGGSVNVSGNAAATGVDIGSLTVVGGSLTVSSNAPTVTVNLGSLTTVGGGTNAASITLGGGTVVVGSSFTVGTNATLTGSATLDGSVTNTGTVAPGSSPGRFDITGNLVLAGSSQLRFELGGYAPGQFDFLQVNGGVALGGTLSVGLISGFQQMMTNGASFTLLTAGSPLTGAFANVASGGTLTTTDGYARFTVRYAGLTSVQLTDFSIIDTDLDGTPDVDEALAGTDPNDPASRFRVISLQPESGSVRLTWSTVGGRSYIVQTNGSLSAPFTDLSLPILVPGSGESATNLVIPRTADSSATYFRVRIVP